MEDPVDRSATGLEPQGIGDEPVGVRFLDLPPNFNRRQTIMLYFSLVVVALAILTGIHIGYTRTKL